MELIKKRQSSRAAFDPKRPVAKKDLQQILEAGSWAPTAHNMQNFEIVVVDDKKVLKKIGEIKTKTSGAFIKENFKQLSFSKEELLKKKTGIMGTMFPLSWRDPNRLEEAIHSSAPGMLERTINGSPTLLLITYDARKRAPASEGDVLGFISLGCVMENMWLMAESLGIGLQIMSVFSGERVEEEVKKILDIPEYLKIAYAARLGYPALGSANYLRVRRTVNMFSHHNKFENKGLG